MTKASRGTSEKKERRKGKRLLWYLLAGGTALLAVIAVASIGAVYIKLGELGNRIAYLQDTTDIIQTNVSNMEANIEATLEEEASLIEDYSIDVVDCDFAAGTYDVQIRVLPKEYTDTTQTSIFFGTQEYPLELEGYAFCGTATLPLSVSYDGNVTILFTDGERRATEVLQNYIGFQHSLQEVLMGSIANMPRYRDGKLTIRDNAAVSLDGKGIYDFTELKLIVTADEQEIYNYDLLTNTGGVIEPEEEILDEDDVADASVATDEGVTVAASSGHGDAQTDVRTDLQTPDNQSGSNGETGNAGNADSEGGAESADSADSDAGLETDDAENAGDTENASEAENAKEAVSGFSTERELNLEYELADKTTVRIYLIATTTEGYQFVYDLFNGVTAEEEDLGFESADDYFVSNYAVYDRKMAVYYP